jgi:hypothetical protein
MGLYQILAENALEISASRGAPMSNNGCKKGKENPAANLLAVSKKAAGHIGNYHCCLSYSPVMGTWRPLAGTTPYIGIEGPITCEPELNVEITILADRFVETMEFIKRVHLYEEPVINAIPL